MTITNGNEILAEVHAGDVENVPLIHVSPLHLITLEVPIRGISPYIAHRWSEKAKRIMLDTQQGKAKPKKQPKDPAAEYNAARYIVDDNRDGIPAVAFKAAIVGAARFFDKSVTMTLLKQLIYVEGVTGTTGPDLLVPIEGQRSMREDCVRVGQGTADLRYRPQYDNWSATLTVQFPGNQITPESVVAMIEAGGFGGVGEWRPSCPKGLTGIYGRFAIGDQADVA
jgi:hypothetical protein